MVRPMDGGTRRRVAGELVDYLTARAAKEGQPMALTRRFFERHLKAGVRCFFGIEVDENGIVGDDQQPDPGFLDRWRAGGEPQKAAAPRATTPRPTAPTSGSVH